MQKLFRILLIGFTFVALNVGTVAAQTGMTQPPVTDGMPLIYVGQDQKALQRFNSLSDDPSDADHMPNGQPCLRRQLPSDNAAPAQVETDPETINRPHLRLPSKRDIGRSRP